jgi:cytoskeletal protein CcmA (bactofilin family)
MFASDNVLPAIARIWHPACDAHAADFTREARMLNRSVASTAGSTPENGKPESPPLLLSVTGQTAKLDGKFEIAESVHIECELGGELTVGERLVVGRRGVVTADVQTVDAVIHGTYSGTMVASGTVEIAATGRVTGNIETDSLVIAKGGFFNGNVVRINRSRDARIAPAFLEEKKVSVAL